MDEGTEALTRRVRALESQARWHRALVAGGLALIAGAGLASGQGRRHPPAPELQARRFVLVNAEGAPLAALEATPEGGPRLALMARGGGARLSLALAADGAPSLVLADAAGRDRVRLEAAGEEARVSVAGKDRSAVTLANGGLAPRLSLADAEGHERLWVALRLGSPAIQFLDQQERARSGLTTFDGDGGVAVVSSTDHPPGLVLYGKNRDIVWSAP